MDATKLAINTGARGFRDRDLYPFIIGFNGYEYANGGLAAVRDKNVIDLKDENGKPLIKGLIAVARKGSGWYDYRWPNPDTGIVEDKSSYVERLRNNEDVLVGVGVYRKANEITTVHVISGSPNADDHYLQMATDLAGVLNNNDNLRVIPIVGIDGPGQNIRDVRIEKGIEIGLTQTGILNNFRKFNNTIGHPENNRIVYIAKLFDEEVHLVAGKAVNGKDITSIEQLRGQKVNVGAEGSGTSYTMRDIFSALNIDVEEVSMSQEDALQKVKSGEIAATALIAGQPVLSMSDPTTTSGLRFVPVPFSDSLKADYSTASLTHDNYPNLIPDGQKVGTVAASTVLITYDWPKTRTGNDRYQRVAKFVEALFNRIDKFKKSPHHPKWQEVKLSADLPGWKRFEPAENWIAGHPEPRPGD